MHRNLPRNWIWKSARLQILLRFPGVTFHGRSVSQGEENSLLDVIHNDQLPSPDQELMKESLKAEIDRALSTLTEREAEVIKLYFGLNKEHSLTLEEIGERFNLTRERVRQIKEKAIRRLRHASQE